MHYCFMTKEVCSLSVFCCSFSLNPFALYISSHMCMCLCTITLGLVDFQAPGPLAQLKAS